MYGHSSLYALRGTGGFLCHAWWASSLRSVVLFTDIKTAKAWIAKVNKHVEQKRNSEYGKLEVQPALIKFHPVSLRATINPSVDGHDVDRIMKRSFYENW